MVQVADQAWLDPSFVIGIHVEPLVDSILHPGEKVGGCVWIKSTDGCVTRSDWTLDMVKEALGI